MWCSRSRLVGNSRSVHRFAHLHILHMHKLTCLYMVSWSSRCNSGRVSPLTASLLVVCCSKSSPRHLWQHSATCTSGLGIWLPLPPGRLLFTPATKLRFTSLSLSFFRQGRRAFFLPGIGVVATTLRRLARPTTLCFIKWSALGLVQTMVQNYPVCP